MRIFPVIPIRTATAITLTAVVLASCAAQPTWAQENRPASEDPWRIDFRYSPPVWQTSICLPDDWQKTLVGKDGALLYDYPGRFSGFGTRIIPGLMQPSAWVKQELASPRVPIVGTTLRSGEVEVFQEAFAVTSPAPAIRRRPGSPVAVERVGSPTAQANWANPSNRFDPAFRDAAIGWAQPVRYRFKALPNERYVVMFGLCEGYHDKPGQRVLALQVEGQTRQTADVFAEHGKNVPALYPFSAADKNGDGWIDLAVSVADRSPDANTILNVLWIFHEGEAPPVEELLAGQSSQPALAHLGCGSAGLGDRPARRDDVIVRLRNTGASNAIVAPTITIESESKITGLPDHKHVQIGASTTLWSPLPFQRVERTDSKLVLVFADQTLPPGSEQKLAFGVARGND